MRLPRILGEALHIAATLPARVWCGLDAAIHGPQPTAWLQARILLLEERVRHAERERDEATAVRDAAQSWGMRASHALCLTTQVLSFACQSATDSAEREALARTIVRAAEALSAAQPGITLDIHAVCARLMERDALAAELALLRVRRAHVDAGPIVRRRDADDTLDCPSAARGDG